MNFQSLCFCNGLNELFNKYNVMEHIIIASVVVWW